MDKVFVERLRLPARVGVYSHEKGREQPIELDIEVDFDGGLEQAARSERLRDTINYEKLAKAARRVVDERHFPLVETLAAEIAKSVLQLRSVHRARVRLRKLGCLEDAAAAGTEVVLEHSADQKSPMELAELETALASATLEPIVVIGSGVAGLSAMLWVHRLGHRALLIDAATSLGGQLRQVFFRMTDIPGMHPINGNDLASRLVAQLPRSFRWLRARVEHVEAETRQCAIDLEVAGQRRMIAAEAVIVCSGWRRRQLGLTSEQRFFGRGILATASKDIGFVRGERVVVVGGGDAGCENALKLRRAGAEVVLVHRRAQLSARKEFRRALDKHSAGISQRLGVQVVALHGDEHLGQVELSNGERIEARWLLSRIGWEPNGELLPPRFRDERGYARVNARLLATDGGTEQQKRLFVAGDLRNPIVPSVATSMGDGACAAKAAVELLEQLR
jgi:thioredoxin reductase (NADPH)